MQTIFHLHIYYVTTKQYDDVNAVPRTYDRQIVAFCLTFRYFWGHTFPTIGSVQRSENYQSGNLNRTYI